MTGASGFIGRALIRELLENDYFVYALVREHSLPELLLSKQCCPLVTDLTQTSKYDSLLDIKHVDVIFHLAWMGVSGKAKADTEVQLKNVQFTLDLLEMSEKWGCKRFVATGSLMELEVASSLLKPCSLGQDYLYGAGKAIAHAMSEIIGRKSGVEVIWPIITNAYGVGETNLRMINSTILKCLNNEEVFFTEGKHNYDFIYVDDVAKALRLLAEKGHAGKQYIIGSGHARPLKEFLLEMQAEIAPEIPFVFGKIPYKGNNVPIIFFDTTELEKDTGFRPEISFREGCRRTYEWWKRKKNSGSGL